ncbi:hypothetical protein [Desulfonema magnum]|uniref:Uncharacterized protein n=1 Tax=Desulfonema magnum TaxID=45655 RepID=A0A975GQ89_9BACT|nr:hypothetical protein [Desulfonema magnum]QTA89640.1 Uncharacterized protein dnm_056960 [Desulfonema magnum]
MFPYVVRERVGDASCPGHNRQKQDAKRLWLHSHAKRGNEANGANEAKKDL